MQTQIKTPTHRLTTRAMHKYVMLGVGIWITFLGTFAIAYVRVSNSHRFAGEPFQALSPNETQKPASSY
ncbi:hypothetical protein [Acaryochloris sp. CCMEE 5410]|uniref:hypothetical protein n=1 Tax=Acaryochloris sp. CCMEE 5410 TaxID=310037 RepID=UPI000493C2F1|nr:hypothetical protein [Acaryochloris sp. CCMEE 5410]KAI9133792.1 hypothetical protein ON05_011135 [Acaryochloris sp. CCMEE 5410]